MDTIANFIGHLIHKNLCLGQNSPPTPSPQKQSYRPIWQNGPVYNITLNLNGIFLLL